ncbi:uncharacterized protein MYCFIDRAFT_171367 [Pseudocercospora fijiensis CIRAD86]|uniref:Uncharacterized protein n=1 Tax=Pseudocercospora fijiensis (strain CIRAD86) TaxID=383855 RepID=M3B7Y8_PSEFD|nr:uncharacterized protein MYCFIDRAFT_171367 [Pseudocercospora fijiensis CIRAD86]EME85437.1 hypothetical protein MYCFIDRAFT_171367 [Pseudocercospora fijiensis CIRAD86]
MKPSKDITVVGMSSYNDLHIPMSGRDKSVNSQCPAGMLFYRSAQCIPQDNTLYSFAPFEFNQSHTCYLQFFIGVSPWHGMKQTAHAWASIPLHDIGTFFKLNLDFLHAELTCQRFSPQSSLSGPHPTGSRTVAPDRESFVNGTAEWEDIGNIGCLKLTSIWVARQSSKGFAYQYDWRPIFFYMIARYWEDDSNLYFFDNIRKLAVDAGFTILFPDPRLHREEPDKPQKPQKTSKPRKTTIGRVTKPEQSKRVLRTLGRNSHSKAQYIHTIHDRYCYTSSIRRKVAAAFPVAMVRGHRSTKKHHKSRCPASHAGSVTQTHLTSLAPSFAARLIAPLANALVFSQAPPLSSRLHTHLLQTRRAAPILAQHQYCQHEHTEHCTPPSDTTSRAAMAFRALRKTLPAICGGASTAAGIGWYFTKTTPTSLPAFDTPIIGDQFEEAAPLVTTTTSPFDVCWASSASASGNDSICALPLDSSTPLIPPSAHNAVLTALATFLLLALLEIAVYYLFVFGPQLERYTSQNVPHSVRSILATASQTYYRCAGIAEIALLALSSLGAVSTSKLPLWFHLLIVAGAILHGLWDFETEPLPDVLELQAQNSDLRVRIEKLKQRNGEIVSWSAKLTYALKAKSETRLTKLERNHQKQMSASEKQLQEATSKVTDALKVIKGQDNLISYLEQSATTSDAGTIESSSKFSGLADTTSEHVAPITSGNNSNTVPPLQSTSPPTHSNSNPTPPAPTPGVESTSIRPPPVPYRENPNSWTENLCKQGSDCIGLWTDYDATGKYIGKNAEQQRWGSGYKPVENKLAKKARDMNLCCDCFKALCSDLIAEKKEEFLRREGEKTEEQRERDVQKQAAKQAKKRARKAENKASAAAAAAEEEEKRYEIFFLNLYDDEKTNLYQISTGLECTKRKSDPFGGDEKHSRMEWNEDIHSREGEREREREVLKP